MCILILFTSGFTVFTKGNWDTAKFVSSYLWVSPRTCLNPALPNIPKQKTCIRTSEPVAD